MDLSSYTEGQRKAITHLKGPLLICAGAGTGKTFTLTQRIAYALTGDPENGVDPVIDSIDEALVITFTNKAAAELKSRFRSMLRSVGRFEDALKVDSAWVSTIHGACHRILKEHALELDIDPEFELVMGAEQEDALSEAINRALHDPSGYERFQPLFEEYETRDIRQILKEIMNAAACQTRGIDAFLTGPAPTHPRRGVYELLDSAQAAAGNCTGKTAEYIDRAITILQEFLDSGFTEDDIPAMVDSLALGSMRGKGAKDFKDQAKILSDQVRANKGLALLGLALDLARMVEGEYQQILADNSKIDTSNLIRKTLRAFDEHPEIARLYTERFKLIMVDEFQDTSQLQIDMIERIAGADAQNLCTVGDSQQSIYRFQGADVGVYLKHKNDMRDAGALMVELQDNFRSDADILAFVRAVCGKPGFFVEDFLDLNAGRRGGNYRGSAPRIELACTMFERGCSSSAVEQEACHIAQRFRELIDAGHKPEEMAILMGATTHMGIYAKALRDQGIPSMAAGGSKFYASDHVKRCLSLVRVLANPYDSESMMDVLSSDVLPVSSDDLIQLSTYFNEEAGMLVRQNFAKGLLTRSRAPQNPSPLLAHAMAVLNRAWKKLGREKPSRIFMDILIDSGWIHRLQEQGQEGQAVLADVLKLAGIIAEREEKHSWDMTRVCASLDASVESDQESTGVLSIEGLQAVRLMTIHGSKGLQFPIVAVTNCATSRAESGPLRLFTDSGVVHASLFPKGCKPASTADLPLGELNLNGSGDPLEYRQKIAESTCRSAEAERRRLFYVATTRAAEVLIVAIRKQITKTPNYVEIEANLLDALFPGEGAFPQDCGTFEYGGSEPALYTRYDIVAEADEDNAAEEPQDEETPGSQPHTVVIPHLEERPRVTLQEKARRSNFYSYSSIAHASPAHQAPEAPTIPETPESPEAAEAATINREGDEELLAARCSTDKDKATDFGTALHMTCEWIALQEEVNVSDIMATAWRFAAQNGVKDTDRLRSALSRWIQSEICERAYAHESVQPEVPFCTWVAGGCMEGEIDLLCTNDGKHAFVVDYKTGGSPTETPSQLHEKHLLQAQCYAYSVLSSRFESVELHFVRVEQASGMSHEPQVVSYAFSVQDLAELEDAICQARALAE